MRTQSLWAVAPATWSLSLNDVHVWLAALNQPIEIVDELWQVLSPDEHERARRFHFQRDREHFIVARATLRKILASYLQIPPAQIQFCYGSHGKPMVAPSYNWLRFNVSHSDGLALYAVSYGRELGIDIEQMRPLSDMDEIASHFFAPSEQAVLRTLPAENQHEAFYACWTRKEAYIKLIGAGLSQPLDQFAVAFGPGERPAVLFVAGDDYAPLRWSMCAFTPAVDYAAALVVEGHDWDLRCWQWQS